jgi:hypothetical protein
MARATHFNFSDNAFLKSPAVQRILLTLGLMKMGGDEQLRLTSDDAVRFFDVYLKGAPASKLRPLQGGSQ